MRYGFLAPVALLLALGFVTSCNGRRRSRGGTGARSSTQGSPHGSASAAAAKAISEGMAQWAGDARDCSKVVELLAPLLQNEATRQNEPSFYALAECARELKRWAVVKAATVRIMRVDPDFAHRALMLRAEIGLGNIDAAMVRLGKLAAAYPEDPEILLTESIGYAAQAKWTDAQRAAEQSLRLSPLSKLPEQPRFDEEANLARADAQVHLGELDDCSAAVDDAEKLGATGAVVAGLRKDLALARSSALVIDEFHQPEIPLGIYHLYGKVQEAGSVVSVTVSNLAPSDRQFRIDAEVGAVAERVTRVVSISHGSHQTISFVPPLLPGFNAALVRSEVRTELTLTITAIETGGERVAYDEKFPVRVLPRDMLPLEVRTGENTTRPAYIYLAAWMTPKAKSVAQIVADAKKHTRGVVAFGTNPGANIEAQVKAVFEELKTHGVSFGMDAACTPGVGTIQKTRLPTAVLESTKAECLEGPILFATLLEALGIPALIVLTPVHAWVGWEPPLDTKSKSPAGRKFLDTTGVHDFDSALAAGQAAYQQEERYKHFEQDVSRIVEVKELRKMGVLPQPWE